MTAVSGLSNAIAGHWALGVTCVRGQLGLPDPKDYMGQMDAASLAMTTDTSGHAVVIEGSPVGPRACWGGDSASLVLSQPKGRLGSGLVRGLFTLLFRQGLSTNLQPANLSRQPGQ